MAAVAIAGAKPSLSAGTPGDAVVATWVLTTGDPTGDAVLGYEDYPDRTVQVFGTFGGATVQLQGRLASSAGYEMLTDPQGNDLTKTAADIEGVLEAVPDMRAQLTVVGAGASITVLLYMRRK